MYGSGSPSPCFFAGAFRFRRHRSVAARVDGVGCRCHFPVRYFRHGVIPSTAGVFRPRRPRRRLPRHSGRPLRGCTTGRPAGWSWSTRCGARTSVVGPWRSDSSDKAPFRGPLRPSGPVRRCRSPSWFGCLCPASPTRVGRPGHSLAHRVAGSPPSLTLPISTLCVNPGSCPCGLPSRIACPAASESARLGSSPSSCRRRSASPCASGVFPPRACSEATSRGTAPSPPSLQAASHPRVFVLAITRSTYG